jgi:hypothetical protein
MIPGEKPIWATRSYIIKTQIMKKILLTTMSICFLGVLHAQILKPKNNNGNNQQSSTSSASLSDADYFLAVAKVSVKTGKDNKENGSALILRVYPAAGTDNWRKGYCQENYKSELKVWSTDNFTLPRAAAFDQNFNSLANYKQTGIMVDINYNTVGNGPFFAMDAWKIEEVAVTLEFKDKNGNPHPTMGSKTIYFTNSNMYLDFKKWQLYCKTDQYFTPLTPTISNRPQ